MGNNEIIKESGIRVFVGLDKEHLPVRIKWEADDGGIDGQQEAKGMMLSLWDGLQKGALRIDLWTKDMSVEEMNQFMFETLMTMGDTYERATNNSDIAAEIREFAHHFGHRAEIFGPDHQH